MSSLSNIALRSFVTGICTTTSVVVILGITWKLFTLRRDKKRVMDTDDLDTFIDAELIDGKNNKDFKRLFDMLG
jgi:hypothetical protein